MSTCITQLKFSGTYGFGLFVFSALISDNIIEQSIFPLLSPARESLWSGGLIRLILLEYMLRSPAM